MCTFRLLLIRREGPRSVWSDLLSESKALPLTMSCSIEKDTQQIDQQEPWAAQDQTLCQPTLPLVVVIPMLILSHLHLKTS